MRRTVFLPQLELNMESVAVVKWLVKVGEYVKADQPILEVETQKAVVQVPSPGSGYVRRFWVREGQSIGEKAPLCILTDTADEPLEAERAASPQAAPSAAQRSEPPQNRASPMAEITTIPSGGPIRAAPAARKLAKDLGIDLARVKGTGPGGRINVEDVERWRRKSDSPHA